MSRGENWRWERLTRDQAEGMRCVICDEGFDATGRAAKAVGSAVESGRPVFACAVPCFGAAIARVKGWSHSTSTSPERHTGTSERW